jgi:hypothetical protein
MVPPTAKIRCWHSDLHIELSASSMDSSITMDDYGIPVIETDESLFSIIPKLSQ